MESVSPPSCGRHEIRLKVDACAVCGSDLKAFLSGNPRIKPPMILGHEFVGTVDTVGADVSGFRVGERVVMATSVSCGECFYCAKGWPNLCAELAAMGFHYPGGLAEYVTIPARAIRNGHVVRAPETMPPEHAALAEPVSCAVNAVENCGIAAGDTVVVVGAGPMGIINACVAREFGATKVIVAEINEARLKQAEQFGFDVLVNPETENLAEIVKAETEGIGADCVIVAAPAQRPQEEALELARKRGTVCLFASLPVGKNMLSVDSRLIHYHELRVVGASDSTPGHVEKALAFLSDGSLPAGKLTTHVLRLDDIAEAYRLMRAGESLRVVLKP